MKDPGGITFVGSDDVEVAARVIHRRSSVPVDTSMADLAGFMLWKQVKHELDSLKRRHFLGRLAIKTKRTSSSNVVRVLYVSNASTFTVGQESLLQLVACTERYTKYALIGQDGHFADRLRHVGATVMCPNRDFTRFTVNNVLYLLDVLKKVAPDTLHFNGEPGMPALVAATFSACTCSAFTCR